MEKLKYQGSVTWFDNRKRGYGFIKPDDGSKDIFVHFSGIISDEEFKKLEKGQRVEFEISTNKKDRIATNVKVIGDQAPKVEIKVEAPKEILKEEVVDWKNKK